MALVAHVQVKFKGKGKDKLGQYCLAVTETHLCDLELGNYKMLHKVPIASIKNYR
eukprot:SAG11_NODE_981_length_6316_cov_7.773042_4_plen_55_part_00